MTQPSAGAAQPDGATFHPGPLNAITDVPGIKVGQAHDDRLWSGVTVIVPDQPMLAAVDVRGGGPGTRETDALKSSSMVQKVHAVVLSGGSAYGLDAASAVMVRLAAEGRGHRVGDAIIPIVPSAILFDLVNGGDKAWGREPPYRRLADQAMDALGTTVTEGNAGAGYGAKAGAYKGGLGSASVVTGEGFTVGALVACNAFGTPVIPGTPCFWAWAHEMGCEFGGQPLHLLAKPTTHDFTFTPGRPGVPGEDLAAAASGERPAVADDADGRLATGDPAAAATAGNTTIGIVAIDADLTRGEAERIAIMAQDGYARAVRPMHTPFDGDTIFVLATGRRPLTDPAADVARLGMHAADCVARALTRGVYAAETLGRYPGYRSIHGHRLNRAAQGG